MPVVSSNGSSSQSRDMLRELSRAAEQSNDLIVVTDRAGIMEYVNPAFENLTGYSRNEAIGKTLLILKSEDQASETFDCMWQTILAGDIFRGTISNRKKNGEIYTVERVISSVRGKDGEITHFISTDHDITERLRLEGELQQARKMDAIGRLAGGVAHDFNNLLMVISAYAELMLDSLAAEHPLRRNVNEIMTASRRAADLTRQLLTFGRKQVQALQLLDLNVIVREISRMLPRLIGEDIELVVVPGENIGCVKADPSQIEQVIMNLAVNARDAMPHGGTLTIETANSHLDDTYIHRRPMVPAGDYVRLAVSDTGQGIAPQHLAHIFEPFYTTKQKGGGTGLGLATVYGIVKQSDGFIWVYSEPGLGATFKVYLPSARKEIAETSTQIFQDSAFPGGCETILLVEDEEAVRRSAVEFLNMNGYIILQACNGKEALQVAREYEGKIDLMITDVVMPHLGGAKLAEQLAAERPEMKVLFVSGYAESTVLRHGPIDIVTQFLQKPFSLKSLAQKIRKVLDFREAAVAVSGKSG
ncbi:MAG TPA: ATP-binding protein [Terriglobales bacterium]|nr:ATP-binding protein [Terriglobales bacterium]